MGNFEIHQRAFCFTHGDELLVVMAEQEQEAEDRLTKDYVRGFYPGIIGLDEFTKVLKTVQPYPELDVVYFEGILTTRSGASKTLSERGL